MAYVVLGVNLLIGAFPAVDVADFIEDEDALSLAFGGLHLKSSTGFMIHSILSLC